MSEVPIARPAVSGEAISRIRALIETGQLADGPTVRTFERQFAGYCETREAVATANGTAALHAALRGLGVDEGDAVITSPFSFVATANAIRHAGGHPVFADIDPDTYTIDPDAIESVLEHRDDVVGIVPVHLYGLAADMPAISAIARRHDLFVLEDACQAHGATIDDEPVGSLGDAACFSFYPTKNMTTGEGGIVTTDDKGLAEWIATFIDHGRSETGRYDHGMVGHNFRMTSLAAAIGLEQLERLPAFLEARKTTASFYDEHLEGTRVSTPVEPPDRTHAYHLYTIRVPDREMLRTDLADRGIETGIYYPRPLHRLPMFADGSRPQSLSAAERATREVLSLPVHPQLTERDRRAVCEAIVAHYAAQ